MVILFPALVYLAAMPAPSARVDLPGHQYQEAPATASEKKAPVATKLPDHSHRITVKFVVERASANEDAFQGKRGYLTLSDPEPNIPFALALTNPQLRDRVQIKLAPEVVSRLKKLGIRDIAVHFKGRTISATGTAYPMLYLCFPAVSVTTVVVDSIDDLEVTGA